MFSVHGHDQTRAFVQEHVCVESFADHYYSVWAKASGTESSLRLRVNVRLGVVSFGSRGATVASSPPLDRHTYDAVVELPEPDFEGACESVAS